MIEYPFLKEQPALRQTVDVFKGYHHNLRIGPGEFYEMENMTSDDYPVLSVRGRRGRISSLQYGCSGMQYVPGKGLFYLEDIGGNSALCLMTPEGERTQITLLNPNPKGLVLMGKKLVIFPDMQWVDIESLSCSKIEAGVELRKGTIYCETCKQDGTIFKTPLPGDTAPPDPVDGDYWVDSSASDHYVLKQYSATQQAWVAITTTYVRISSQELGNHGFRANDTVTISGLGIKDGTIDGSCSKLNGSHMICSIGMDYIVIEGLVEIPKVHSCGNGAAVTISRGVPQLDYVVEAGNRLWGCKKSTNEIYACKLGDIFNWNCFQGLSTDSWVASIGTPGEFTGAVVQNGYPIFYKEDCKHKVWPSSTGAHQVAVTPCNGVEKGSESSLAVLGGTVFYKSPFGICADDGGGPVDIGRCFGSEQYHNACGAVHDQKYYICMCDGDGKSHLFVYDLSKKLWHREDSIASECIASGGGGVYVASEGELWDLTGKTGTPEGPVSWMVQTGDLGLEIPEQKYISRLTLRVLLEPGATLEIYARYDREPLWVELGQVCGTSLKSFSLPVRPRRCDQLRLKLQGTGMCKVYSITKTLEKGSELP